MASCRVRLCGRVGGVAWYRGCSPLGAQLAVGDELIEDVEGALAYNEKEVCVGRCGMYGGGRRRGRVLRLTLSTNPAPTPIPHSHRGRSPSHCATSRDFSSRYASMAAPATGPFGSTSSRTNLPKRLLLWLLVVHALQNAWWWQ